MTHRLKIPHDITACPSEGNQVSTDGLRLYCPAGCKTTIPDFPGKMLRRWLKQARPYLPTHVSGRNA